MRSLLMACGSVAVLAVAAAAGAQSPVRVFGIARSNAGEFVLEGTRVRLQSSTINLHPWTGQPVDLAGTVVAVQPVPRIEVASIVHTDHQFVITGDRIGDSLLLRIDAPGATFFFFYFSFTEGFLPLEPYQPIATGTLLTDLATTVTVEWGWMGLSWSDLLPIPNDPRLIGARILFQAAVHEIPGPVLYLNAEEVVFRR